MSKEQLDNLKKKVGVCPQLEQNGRLLHIHKPLGAFHEWIVLSYNLNVLAEIIRENMELHRKLAQLTDRYIQQVEITRTTNAGHYIGTGTNTPQFPINPAEPFPNVSDAIMMMNQKIKDVNKKIDRLDDLVMNKLAGCGSHY